jgi:hypothetical protein
MGKGIPRWFYSQQGQEYGPVSGEALKELAKLGRLQPTDYLWAEGMKEWAPASKVKGLFAAGFDTNPINNEASPVANDPLSKLAAAAQQSPTRNTMKPGSAPRCQVKTKCVNCGAILAVPYDSVGKKVKCPKCSTVFLVPSPSGQTQPNGPAAVANRNSNELLLTGTVTEVCTAYRDMNPLVAERQSRGKLATVTGEILSIMPLSNTVVVVLKCLLQEGGDLGCIFGAEQRTSLEKVLKGQTVTIKGTMKPAGDHFGLEGCVLLSARGQTQPNGPAAVANRNSNELLLTGTITEVCTAYRDMNPLVAERLHRGKLATVTGQILSIMPSGSTVLVILKCHPRVRFDLVCWFGAEQRTSLETISNGQTVTVRGTMKTNGDNLQLEECRLL